MKTIILLCITSMMLSLYAIAEVHDMPKSNAFSAENVARVRANIPKEVPYREEALKEANAHYNESVNKEIGCLQMNIFWEARDQSELARVAVGWVTLNRVTGERYPNSVCEVVYQGRYNAKGVPKRNKCKFSWWCDGKSDQPNLNNRLEREAWEQSGEIAEHLVKHCLMKPDSSCPDDPTNGAEYYFNPSLADPSWKETKVKTATIDDHEFYSSSLASAH